MSRTAWVARVMVASAVITVMSTAGAGGRIKTGVGSVEVVSSADNMSVERASTVVPGPAGGYEALNPTQRLHVYFFPDGVRVTPDPRPSPSWEWGLTLTAYGNAGEVGAVGTARLAPRGNGIEYLRGDLDEWYINSDRGLVHGFALEAPPEGDLEEGPSPLHFDLAVRGKLSWRPSDDGQSVEFLNPGGNPVLRYGDLLVTDAEGRGIAARMEVLPAASRRTPDIRLVVEAMDAVYPVTIEARLISTAGRKSGAGSEPTVSSDAAGYEVTNKRSSVRMASGFQLLSVPSNDMCTGAETIPAGGPFPYLTSLVADITDATTSDDPAVPSCQPDVSRSLWYAFTPSLTAVYTFSSCAGGPTGTTVDDTVLAIYTSSSGCAGSFTEQSGACNDDSCIRQSVVSATLTAGTTYYILAWQFGTTPPPAGQTAVQLRVTERPFSPPSNDTCTGAETVPGNGPFPYVTAVTSDITDASLTGDPPAPSCQTNVDRSIWYTFTPTATNDYTISSCADAPTGTTVDDTVMAIYTSAAGCAGPFTQAPGACDNDACTFEAFQAVVSANLTAGTTYYILVWQLGATAPTAGNTAVQLRISQPGAPPNDGCGSATPLALDTPVSGTTALAADDYELSGSGCFTGVGQVASTAPGRDAAYSFVSPGAGSYSFRVTGYSSSLNLVTYLAGSCPSGVAPVTVTSCLAASNRSTSSSSEEVMCVPLSAGQTAYAFVDENALTAGSAFKMEVNRCAREVEPNNTPVSANSFTCGMEGTIDPNGEADFFSLGNPASGSRAFAIVDGVAANSNDFDLRVTSATDTLEYDDQNNDAPFGSLAANVAGTPLTGGTAYLRVSHFSSIRTSEPYRLYAAVQPSIGSATTETEPNGTIAQANSAANNYFYGSLSALTDNDVYAFAAVAGDVLFLSLDGDPLRNNTPINAALTLLDASGLPLVAVNDGGSTSSTTSGSGSLTSKTPNSPAEGLTYMVTASGTYYALVTGSTVGDYLLSIASGCRVRPATDLSVSETDSPDPVASGAALTYTVTVANNGPSSAANVILTDTLPSNATFSLATPSQGSCLGSGPVICYLGDISSSNGATVQIGVTAGGTGSLVNTAQVSSAVEDADPSNDVSMESTTVCSGAPTGIPDLSIDPNGISWPALAGATGYDVVRGDLAALSQSHGNFTTATLECLANDLPQTSLGYADFPAVGQGFWLLVRGVSCGGNGTYDSGGTQVGQRDSGINASAFSCP